jgi:hypothetical protein
MNWKAQVAGSDHHLAMQDMVVEGALLLGAGCEPEADGVAAWTIPLTRQTSIYVEHDTSEAQLVLSCTVAEVPVAARARVYEMLLQFNALWSETGGLRMALAGTPSPVVLIGSVPTLDLAPARLGMAMSHIVDVALTWRSIVDAAATQPCDAPESVQWPFTPA